MRAATPLDLPAPEPVPSVAPSPSAPRARATSAEHAPSEAPAIAPSRNARDLADEIREAAGGSTPPPGSPPTEDTAPSNPDGIAPAYPSIGAINSALARALPAAQACVDGDVPLSRASVRFESGGTVESVSVRGWAAGKPAEKCIRDALTKARVAPFVQPSYVVPVTIRSSVSD
jgi:hypothetical protein